MELSVSLDTICRIIVRARELEAQVPSTDPDETDEEVADADDAYAVLVDEDNQAVEAEVLSLLEDLADDQIAEVLALAWVGRGTYDASEWDDALEAASDPDAESPTDQLLEMPLLAACLDAGLAAFDLSCEGVGQID
ncbi:DUF3775 domain-containing protein [Flavisphingomonas formosensis]|uniref:DUF3775 domain-containing protein n=1 Tax=Flavisphingomonas formosensis TaxID=861534 RepID=UPI0012FAAF00|nr:DUF3775 domain-containing protein [Sphingomonas formosensis]